MFSRFVSYLLFFSSFGLLTSENVVYLPESLETTLDRVVQDLTDKYSISREDNFWHPYIYGTADAPREVVKIRGAEWRSIEASYIQWKHTRLGLAHLLIGLTMTTVDVWNTKLEKIFSIQIEPNYHFVAMTVFNHWDDVNSQASVIILTATNEPALRMYRVDEEGTQQIGEYVLHYEAKDLIFCHLEYFPKVILVPKSPDVPIDLYNVEVSTEKGYMWFFQRLPEKGNVEVVTFDSQQVESIIAISNGPHINIYKFRKEDGGYFGFYQAVPVVHNCVVLLSFTLNYKPFIGCVLEQTNTLEFIEYNGTSYKVAEGLGLHPAVQAASLTVDDYRDDTLLITQDENAVVRILSYVGRVQGFVVVYSCNPHENKECPRMLQLNLGARIPFEDGTVFILPSQPGAKKVPLIAILEHTEQTLSPEWIRFSNLFKHFEDLSRRLKSYEQTVDKAEDVLRRSLLTYDGNHLTGKWTVDKIKGRQVILSDPEVEGRRSGRAESFGKFNVYNVEWSQADLEVLLDDVETQIKTLRSFSARVKHALANAVFKDVPETQVVRANHVVFRQLSAGKLIGASMRMGTIGQNGEDVNEFLNNFVVDDISMDTSGPLMFEKPLALEDLVVKVLNGIHVAGIARLSHPNIFQHHVFFNNTMYVEGSVDSPTLGGLVLPEHIVNIQSLEGIVFEDGILVDENVDATHLYHERIDFDRVLLSSGNQDISSHINFQNAEFLAPISMQILNGVNCKSLFSRIVTTDYTHPIHGMLTVNGNMEVGSLHMNFWNGRKFPDDFIHSSDKNLILGGQKKFAHIMAPIVHVDGFVDGKRTQDLIPLHSPLNMDTKWTFLAPVSIQHNLNVYGTVNGVDLNALNPSTPLQFSHDHFNVDVDIEFEQPVVFESLHINSSINEHSFDALFGETISFNGPECYIPGVTTITKNVHFGDVTVKSGHVNGVSIENNILTTNGDQYISGNYIFANNVTFSGLVVGDRFDTVLLKDFVTTTLLPYMDRNIHSHLHFEQITCMHGAEITGLINKFENFETNVALVRNRPHQVFRDNLIFKNLIVDHLEVTGDTTIAYGKTIGNLDFVLWNEQRIALSSNEDFTKPILVYGNVIVNRNLGVGVLNDVNMEAWSEATYKKYEEDQLLSHSVVRYTAIQVNNGTVVFEDTVSDHDLNVVAANAIPLYPNTGDDHFHEITGTWAMRTLAVGRDLNVQNLVCGVNLGALNANSVKKHEPEIFITGTTQFPNGLYVEKDLTAKLVNGEPLFDELIHLHGPAQVIEPPVYFYNDVLVHGHLDLTDAPINGIHPSKFTKRYEFVNGNTHVVHHSIKIYGDPVKIESLTVNGSVNGYNLTDVFATSVLLDKGEVSPTVFEEKVFHAPVKVEGDSVILNYNGVDLSRLFANILRTNEEWNVTNAAVIKHMTTPLLIVHRGNVEVEQFVGSTDFNQMLKDAVSAKEGHFSADTIHFDHLIIGRGIEGVETVNYHNVLNFIPLHTRQSVGALKFKEVTFTGNNLAISGRIDGVDVNKAYMDSLKVNFNKPQYVKGVKQFRRPVRINGNFNCLPPSFLEKIVPLNQDYKISSRVAFAQPVRVDGDMTAAEDQSVARLVGRALTSEDDEVIGGQWDFQGGITFQEVVEGSVQLKDYDLTDIINEKNREVENALERVNAVKRAFKDRCLLVDQLGKTVLSAPLKLQYFDPVQVLESGSQMDKIITVSGAGGLHLLASHKQSCSAISYKWNPDTQTFAYQPELLIPLGGHIKKWKSITHDDKGILIFSLTASPGCTVEHGLYISTLDGQSFSQYKAVIADVDIVDFTLVHDSASKTMFLWVVTANHAKNAKVYTWKDNSHGFQLAAEFPIATSKILGLEAVANDDHLSIMLKTIDAILFAHLYTDTLRMVYVGHAKFYADVHSPMSLFATNGAVYGVVQEHGTNSTLIKPQCTLQIFRLFNNVIRRVQKLKAENLIDQNVFVYNYTAYLNTLSSSMGLQQYRFMGLTGMQLLNNDPIQISNGAQVHCFEVTLDAVNKPFVAVLTKDSIQFLKGVMVGDYTSSFTTLSIANTMCDVDSPTN